MHIEIEKNSLPKKVEDVCELRSAKWACETTNILKSQKLSWSLFYGEKNLYRIDAFNYGDGVCYDPSINQQSSCVGKIFTQELKGEELYTDVVLHKGNIKYISHRNALDEISEEIGQVFLKINSFVYMNFNKHTGYVKFQTIGKNIISVSMHIEQNTIDLYGQDWETKLINLYSGKSWK